MCRNKILGDLNFLLLDNLINCLERLRASHVQLQIL